MPISEKEFYEMKSDVSSNTKDIISVKGRLDSVEKKQEMLYEMNKNISLMAASLKHVENDMGEVKETQKDFADKISTLENAPAQETLNNLKKIKIAAITAIVTMVATGTAGAIIVALANNT